MRVDRLARRCNYGSVVRGCNRCHSYNKGVCTVDTRTIFQLPSTLASVSRPVPLNVAQEALSIASNYPEIEDRVRVCVALGVDYIQAHIYVEVVQHLNDLVAQERLAAPPHLLLMEKPARITQSRLRVPADASPNGRHESKPVDLT